MSAPPGTLSQAKFAAHIGRSPGLISQWKTAGKLTAECFTKDDKGRDVVIVDKALEVLGATLDAIQVAANGKPLPEPADNLPFGDSDAGASGSVLPRNTIAPRATNTVEEMNLERLKKVRRENEIAEEERRAAAGTYVLASEVSGAFVRTIEQILAAIDSDLLALAEALAGKHGTDTAVELVGLRQWFAKSRTRAAREQAAMLDRLPKLREDPVEGASDDGDSASRGAAPGGGTGVEGPAAEAAA